jgi:hypothetical protein
MARDRYLVDVLNPIGQRLIGGRELSISEEGVLFRPWVEPRGRPIIDTIYICRDREGDRLDISLYFEN